jgi:hypothetical protein
MNIQSFGTTRVPILGLALRSLGKKCHLDVAPMENHIVYYREGNGASSQRLHIVKIMFEVISTKSITPLEFNLH